MEERYDIRENLPEPNPGRYKDFDALLRDLERNPAPAPAQKRNIGIGATGPLFWAVAASVTLLLGTAWFFWPKPEGETLAQRALPLPGVALAADRALVNAELGDTLFRPNGSCIIIPPAAFVHADGRSVKGEVEISCREINNVPGLFLSGLPMRFSNGKQAESAGVIEVEGSQNAQPIFIAPEKHLAVALNGQLASGTPVADLSVYRLDPEKTTWVAAGQDRVDLLGATDPKQSPPKTTAPTTNADPALKLPTKPIEPVRSDPNRYAFELDLDPSEFPELSGYREMTWQVAPGSTFKDDYYDIEWSDLKLERLPESSFYSIRFTRKNGNGKAPLVVEAKAVPVVSDAAYGAARQEYLRQLAAYESAVASRNQSPQKTPEPAAPAAEATDVQLLVNRFDIAQFGTWACLRAMEPSDSEVQLPELRLDGRMLAHSQSVYASFGKRQTFFGLKAGQKLPQFSDERPTLLWTVLGGNEVVVWTLENGEAVLKGRSVVTNETDLKALI